METIKPSLRFFVLVMAAPIRGMITGSAILIAEDHGVLSVAELQERGLRAVRTLGADLTRDGGDAHLSDDFLVGAILYTACEAMASHALRLSEGPSKRRVAQLWLAIKAKYAWLIH